jgi:ATP-binding cassette subfamily G (WHITE) protein 2 (PDR)
VEKHHQYAFYHQSAEAVSSYMMELPYKITNAITFNTMVYWLSGLRREPGPYFFFVLTNFLVTLAMSGLYRTIASIARTSHQALVPVAIITIGVMIYTGFTIPTEFLPRWSGWIRYIDPIRYGFEALLANEFHGREFPCAQLIPFGGPYNSLPDQNRACPEVGAFDRERGTVNGDSHIELKYSFYHSHKWR